MPTDPAIYDHLRPSGGTDGDATDTIVDPGIYRVVGTQADGVTLLRVADEDGHRRHTGAVTTVDRTDLGDFKPVENPDGNRSVVGGLTSQLADLAWMLRAFVQSLAARPVPSGAAVTIYLFGQFGDRILTAPDWLFSIAVFVGIVALVSIGSGRV